ncbi:MAG: OsmC family protein [Actinomycetes bacterium]
MEAQQLREIQRPLKQTYKDDPSSARIPARAEGRLEISDVACHVTTWHAETLAGLHPAAGGSGEAACSADMLLEALVACAGVTLSAVATSMSVALRGAKVIAEGHWDARGTLGVDRDAPVGMTDVALRFEVDTEADDATIERLVSLTERYCVIAQTLAHPPTMTFDYVRLGA